MVDLERIQHVVVLMLENRSYDHMLGFLDHPKLPPLPPETANPLKPSQPGAGEQVVFPLTAYDALSRDPGHGYLDVMEQLTGSPPPWPGDPLRNNGFVWNFEQRSPGHGAEIMGCYSPDAVPVLATLAREFAVCPLWFCSLPSETWPNRLFAHMGSSDNLVYNEVRFYSNRTVFEQLSSARRTWQVYAGDIPQAACFPELVWHDRGFRFSTVDEFFDDAREGSLPNYSFLEPAHFTGWANSQHPLQLVTRGEQLLSDVYGAIADNVDLWRSTLLIVTYDEHGGFFDRVPPPPAPPPLVGAADPAHGFRFDLLGPRVPAVVISAYIPPGTVDHETHDHTSLIKTLHELFAIKESLSDRDAQARSVLHLLTLDDPRNPPPLPSVPEPIAGPESSDVSLWADGVEANGTIRLNDYQRSLVQLKLLLDEEGAKRDPAQAETLAVPVTPPFSTEGEVEAFVADFRERHLTPPGAPPPVAAA